MSQESEFVDVTYRGLKVAHKARFRDATSDGGFVELETPLPVGALVVVVRESATHEARVLSVVEQEANAKSPPGMKLRWAKATAAANVAPAAGAAPAATAPAATEDAAPASEPSASGEHSAAPDAVDEEGGMSGPVDASGAKKKRGSKKKNGR